MLLIFAPPIAILAVIWLPGIILEARHGSLTAKKFVLVTAVISAIALVLTVAFYFTLRPTVTDSDRMVVSADNRKIQRIAPGISVEATEVVDHNSSNNSYCKAYVFRDNDGTVKMIGSSGPCAQQGDDFDAVQVVESDVAEPQLRIEWSVRKQYDYGWFLVGFKQDAWEDSISRKVAIIEVPQGEKQDLTALAHQ